MKNGRLMHKIHFLKSVKFKLMIAIIVIGYFSSLFFLIGQFWLKSDNLPQDTSTIKSWYEENIKQNIYALSFKRIDEANTLTLKKTLQKIFYDNERQHLILSSLNNGIVRNITVVDKQSRLMLQLGEHIYSKGDIGNQLPIRSRDDLSDKLIGHNNSGLEQYEAYSFVFIQSLLSESKEIIGAIIFHLTLKEDFAPVSPAKYFINKVLMNYLLISFLPLVYILPCGLIIIFFSFYKLENKLKHLYSVIACWSEGEFDKKIITVNDDEISVSFKRLNEMSENLALLIAENNKLAGMQERQYLAMELHDTVKQQLFSNNLTLASCLQLFTTDIDNTQLLLKKAIAQNKNIFESINQLITTLHQEDTSEDFFEKYHLAIAMWRKETLLNVDVLTDIEEGVEISAQLKPIVYRAMKEGLRNVYKHSTANMVKIDLTVNKGSTLFKIFDNGNEVEEIKLGLGLSTLKKQVENQLGCLTFEAVKIHEKHYGNELTLCFKNRR